MTSLFDHRQNWLRRLKSRFVIVQPAGTLLCIISD